MEVETGPNNPSCPFGAENGTKTMAQRRHVGWPPRESRCGSTGRESQHECIKTRALAHASANSPSGIAFGPPHPSAAAHHPYRLTPSLPRRARRSRTHPPLPQRGDRRRPPSKLSTAGCFCVELSATPTRSNRVVNLEQCAPQVCNPSPAERSPSSVHVYVYRNLL